MTAESPRIARHDWGRIELADGRTFKDAKLYPGGAREWDWRETGTRHEPGIQPADVMELIDNGAVTIVLSKGVMERLNTSRETLDFLADRGIEVQVLQTEDAIAAYNRLRDTQAVGGLFHSTC